MTYSQEVEDRLAIRELADRYTLAVTRRYWDDMAECFHTDAHWITSAGHHFRGREEIRQGISGVVEEMEFLVQMQHAIVIEDLTETTATARSVLNEFGRRMGGEHGVFVLGVYTDEVAKVDGAWRFKTRFFQNYYLDLSPPPGMMMVNYNGQI